MSARSAASPLDLNTLASLFEEWKYGVGKNVSIIRSFSAIVSIVASTLLVWILLRSRNGIKTTYHRLLFGLSISDILLSLGFATFGAAAPSDFSYAVWNARGSRASCDAFGFMWTLGGFSGLLYMCSLNLYFLAKVKFNKTDYYVAKKLEPWLHFAPALCGFTPSIVILAKQGMNAGLDGLCSAVGTFEPPHCDGYEDGDTPEGFEIPCGRGRSAKPIMQIAGLITLLVPITIGGSLWAIYRSVLRTEQRMLRYGSGALQANRTQPASNDVTMTDTEGEGGGGRRRFSILSTVRSRFGGGASRTRSNNQDLSQSSAVLHRAGAYSVAYFVTWIWFDIYLILTLAGAWKFDLPAPLPKWQIAYLYVLYFFSPLQGMWTLLVYIQPHVIRRKRSSAGNISWFRAFADALLSAVAGHTDQNSNRRGRDRASPGAPRTTAAPGYTRAKRTDPVPPSSRKGRNIGQTASTVGFTDQQGNRACAEAMGHEAEDPEEEKREIQEHEPSV